MLSNISIKRPITTIMITLMVILAGLVAYFGLNMALMPTIDIPVALVSTSYSGAGPSEMENLVTKPIEEALASVSNVDKLRSYSSNGSSMVIIQFVDGTDIDMAAIDIREKIDMVKGRLPSDATDPMVLKMDMNAQPVSLGVTSDSLDLNQLNDLLEENVVKRLERIEGVSAVNLSGGKDKEIEITVSPDKLSGYGLTTQTISQLLRAENTNLPSGKVSQGNSSMQIRTIGEFTSIEDIKDLPITLPTGGVIHLSDVAEVKEIEKERNSYSLINGKEGILISIDKQSTANLVDVSNRINETLAQVGKDNPDITINMLTDTSDYIKLSISNVTTTAFQSAVVAVIVLFLFLRSPVTSLIIGVSIPTSIFAAFALMYLRGGTLNIISMGGITIGIGMLVDNSVVVLDNIFKYWQRGYEPKEAAKLGAKEISMAVTASTLTTIAVFLPLLFLKGSVGQMLQDLAFSICFSLGASLFVSLTFVPMACSILMARQKGTTLDSSNQFNRVLDKWGDVVDSLDDKYRKVLIWALSHKKRVVIFVIVAFIGTLAISPLAGFDFMPTMDEGTATISIKMPRGTKIQDTEAVVDEVLYRIQDLPELDLMYASVGGSNNGLSTATDRASIYLNLVKIKDRTRSTEEVCEEIKELVADIPGTDITISSSSNAMGSFGGADVTFNITGYDMDTLLLVEKEVKELLSDVDGLKEVSGSSDETIPEIRVKLDRKKASQYGITTASTASIINTAVNGSVASTYKIDGKEMDILIRYDKETVGYLPDLSGIMITAPSGIAVPLDQIADISVEDSPTQIQRENQKKYVTISANCEGIDTNTAKKRVDTALEQYNFPDGYTYNYGGTLEQMMKAFSSLLIAFVIAVLLIYMIMASQFESLIYPAIVMFSMPLAITGGILGLLVTGNSITVTAFMGFIMLVGMVVNNAIVLVDYTNQLMDRGLDCDAALVKAGPRRLRPILMTTLTTVVGLLPMAMGSVEGMEMQRPLGIAVIFGLALSTVITLIFIPVLYSIINEKRKKRQAKKAAELQAQLT